ncbi:MAG: hypothetical protein IJ874_06495 [Ruminococcus sp.]|nr:hypothetical protein [Ruminococcus sp.]
MGVGTDAWHDPGLTETERDSAAKGLKSDSGCFVIMFLFFYLNDSLYTFG